MQVTVEQIFNLGSAPEEDDSRADHSESASGGPSQVATAEAESLLGNRSSGSAGSRRSSGGSRARRAGTGSAGMGTAGAGIGVSDVVFAPCRLVLGVLSGVWYLIGAYESVMPCHTVDTLPEADKS